MSLPASKTFEFASLGLGSVLKLYRLAVPPYQREYSWDTDRVEQLYADLAFARSEGSDYFLGTIVTIPRSSDGVLEVVDGQQRLTTTALFLAAMRDYLLDTHSGQMVVESIENEFLSTIDRRASERIPRLKLNVDDNEFFLKLVSRGGIAKPPNPRRESHERLIAAARAALKMVKNIVSPFSEQHRVDALNDWLEFIESKATVILLKAPDSAQAFRMFETLNDRGLKTSQVDLVKSYLFGQVSRRTSEAQAKWSSMRNMLEEIDDDDRGINFLRHTLISTRQFTRSDDVYVTVQNSVKGETNAVAFLSDLEALSRAYVATYRPDSDQWHGYPVRAVTALKIINKFNIKPLRPLLLSIGVKFSQAEAAAAFEFLVSFSVRLLIASTTRSGSIEETIAAVALQVYQDTATTAGHLKLKLSKITPNDAVFKEAFTLCTVSKSDYARYYLRTLEGAATNTKEPWTLPNDDPTEITLEHILPKNPNAGEWLAFEGDMVQKYSRRLGNLCLLQKTPNSSARSDEFVKKRALYADSPYVLTSEVAKFSEWGPNEIAQRQQKMADIAVRAWPV